MHRVRMLKHHGVTPLLVFDGGLLPSKEHTEAERERSVSSAPDWTVAVAAAPSQGQSRRAILRALAAPSAPRLAADQSVPCSSSACRKRTAALGRANALLAEGKASQAREHFVKAVDVSPAMAYQLIKVSSRPCIRSHNSTNSLTLPACSGRAQALRKENVQVRAPLSAQRHSARLLTPPRAQYIVAPYEADPQLAYLERQGIVDGIITEDSDLLIFGCRNVLFKLDNDGQCVEVKRENFTRCREYNFNGWTDVEFRQMAILSGCDYLDSVPGMGLKTAFKLMRKYKTAEKVIQPPS